MKFFKEKLKLVLPIILLGYFLSTFTIAQKIKYDYEPFNKPIIEHDKNRDLVLIGQPLLESYLEKYKRNSEHKSFFTKIQNIDMAYYTYENSELIAGNNNLFAISTVFKAYPVDKNKIGNIKKWGEVTNGSEILCNWTLIVKNLGNNKYQLIDIVDTKDFNKTLNVDDNDLQQVKTEVTNEKYSYKVENDKVSVTIDQGSNWIDVPVSYTDLVNNKSSESGKNKLFAGSYYISNDKIAFIYENGTIIMSKDKGKTWTTTKLDNQIPGTRRAFVGFSEDGFGYAFITGDKTMSFEITDIYTTSDNGENWSYKGHFNDNGSFLLSNVTFASKDIGFVVYVNGEILITKDSMITWEKLDLPIPDDKKSYYDTPVSITFDGDKGVMYVGQGDDYDYGAGDNQVVKLTSSDKGLSWKYEGEKIR